MVKKALRASGDGKLIQVAKHLDYIVAFKSREIISANLSEMWLQGMDNMLPTLVNCVELALAQDQLLDGIDDPNGVQG